MVDGTFCAYRKGNLGAVKCRAFGEWLDGHWRVSGAGKVCLALVAEALLAMAAVSWVWCPLMCAIRVDFEGDARHRGHPPAPWLKIGSRNSLGNTGRTIGARSSLQIGFGEA